MQIQTTKNSKRGFFFTAMALAILSFMLLTTQVWVRTFELKDGSAAARFKGEAMRSVLSILSDEAMSEFANASAFYAVSRLADATAIEGLAPAAARDPGNPGTGKVENTTYELMMYGNSSPSGTLNIDYPAGKKEAYTISAWQDKIRAAANVMGFNASFGEIENFTIAQADPWTIRTHFEMQMDISDLENTMRQSRRLRANTSFSINGFVDPMVVRNELARRPSIPRDPGLVAQKQIWKNPAYNVPADVQPGELLGSGYEGYGWFFGPLAYLSASGTASNGSGLEQSILVVSEINANTSQYASAYGAVIVSATVRDNVSTYLDSAGCNVTEHKQENCLNCLRWVDVNDARPVCKSSAVPKQIYANGIGTIPMIVGGNVGDPPPVRREGLTSQKFALIDNEVDDQLRMTEGYHRIWDVTSLRDMAICGFYVGSPAGPSFFQRMLAGTPPESQKFGIESFLVGKWAGGADDKDNDILSRLDWEFYDGISQASIIKGMPGCKNKAMCGSSAATNDGVGKFKMSTNAIDRYSLPEITCAYPGKTSAPC